MHDIRVRLFYFIKQNQAVRVPPDLFGQLPSFFVTDVAWGSPDQLGSRRLVHVFGHIKPNHCVLGAKELLSQLLGRFRLADPRWANEQEAANWPSRLVEPNPVPPDGPSDLVNGFVLANDVLFQFLI